MVRGNRAILFLLAGLFTAATMLVPQIALGHCDTMDGPVVADAKAALSKGQVDPVLKWVNKAHEEEIRTAFKKTLAVRGKGEDAKELADLYFFETLVRVHRAGEGAPYTGLKPAGTDPGPAVRASDESLQSAQADALVKLVTDKVAEGIRQRFAHAAELRKHADHNVDAGRQYVKAYVEFVHYVERLYEDATRNAAHAEAPEAPVHEHR